VLIVVMIPNLANGVAINHSGAIWDATQAITDVKMTARITQVQIIVV